ncbi:uncharacterized protein LOC143246134 [Tachypleus tridentatus]|uniref:uncharacterized protein LOC143246134 n=1 Tax=Tachypleus tridentatus TaxID=6853 RepID=UPI003FCEE6AF
MMFSAIGPYGVIETDEDKILVNKDTGDLIFYEFDVSDTGVYKCTIEYWTRKWGIKVEKPVIVTHFLEDSCQPEHFRGTKEETCVPSPNKISSISEHLNPLVIAAVGITPLLI